MINENDKTAPFHGIHPHSIQGSMAVWEKKHREVGSGRLQSNQKKKKTKTMATSTGKGSEKSGIGKKQAEELDYSLVGGATEEDIE
eukprot:scaffold1946_cov188-Ochromonas_danica.AAC.6